jgi:hypothetical protein
MMHARDGKGVRLRRTTGLGTSAGRRALQVSDQPLCGFISLRQLAFSLQNAGSSLASRIIKLYILHTRTLPTNSETTNQNREQKSQSGSPHF